MSVAVSVERVAALAGVEIAYQSFGDSVGQPLLLIMGLGAQMLLWPEGLCERLAERGFFAIRFDNRDSGHSTVLHDLGAPSLRAVLERRAPAPYELSDMAADAAGLLDELGIGAAHVAGASLGGMVAQTLAIERPERVSSLASIMSTTGDRRVGQPTPEAIEVLMAAPPLDDRDAYVESTVAARAVIGSRGLWRDEAWTREIAGRAFDRGIWPDGTLRQLAASVASRNRTEALRAIEAPTVVIHGAQDPLIDVSGGRATAAAIPGAELVVIDGMGHDLPPAAWDRIIAAIAANAARAAPKPG
jgi:pimeloyl-ACP methyl ester carboxylesterase